MMAVIWLICLSSDILKRSKKESLYTIAYELAHVYLEIPKTASMIEGYSEKEKEVDKQVIRWNFEPELRKTRFDYMYGEGSIQNEFSADAI